MMVELAGGWSAGDRACCRGASVVVTGPPARRACIGVSVAVRYDDGRVVDERVSNLIAPPELSCTGGGLPQRLQGTADSGSEKHGSEQAVDTLTAGSTAVTRSLARAAASSPASEEADAKRVQVDLFGREAGWGLGNRILVDRHAPKPLGGELEAGYGIGNRHLEHAAVAKPLGGELEAGYGIGHRDLPDRAARELFGGEEAAGYGLGHRILPDRHAPKPLGGELEAGYGIGNRHLERATVAKPLGGELEAGYGIGHRDLPDKLARGPVGGEEAAGYGLGHRILPDRHVPKPSGGELEAGYGIGNRHLSDSVVSKAPSRELDSTLANGSCHLPDSFVGRVVGRDEVTDAWSAAAAAEATAAAAAAATSQPGQEEICHSSRATQAEEIVREKIFRNYKSLHDAFRALDRSNNGYVSRADFLEAMAQIFLVDGFGQDDVDDMSKHFDLYRDGAMSYAEFAALLSDTEAEHAEHGTLVEETDCLLQAFRQSVEQRHSSHRVAFRTMDTNRDSWLDRDEFAAALRSYHVEAKPRQVDAMLQHFGADRNGRVSYADFCRVLASAPHFEKHLKRQMFHPPARV